MRQLLILALLSTGLIADEPEKPEIAIEQPAPEPSEPAEALELKEDFAVECEQEIKEEALAQPQQPKPEIEPEPCPVACEPEPCCDPCDPWGEKRWFFELQPAYFFFTDQSASNHFNGGFTGRGEIGYRFWKPLIVFVDGGYFQQHGHSIGGGGDTHIQVASITLGLKAIYYFHNMIAGYVGAGPRLFMAAIHNESEYVRGKDEAFGLGGGFDAGVWLFPFYGCCNWSKDIFLDLFADYSLKTIKFEDDDAASDNFKVNISGVTAGLGLGIRF